jgi:hypothetical protein
LTTSLVAADVTPPRGYEVACARFCGIAPGLRSKALGEEGLWEA